jgi:hypothetical protein
MEDDARSGPGGMSRQILIIKITAVVLGLLILLVTILVGLSNVSSDSSDTEKQEALDLFMLSFGLYTPANAYDEPLAYHFDVLKLNSLTPQQIAGDLEPGYAFSIEIIDVSQYDVKYTYSQENGTAFEILSTGSKEITGQRAAVLIIGEQRHAAILKITLGGEL